MTYKIIRSRRKSVCISVTAENEVSVRCPLYMSEQRIKDFVESKTLWLEKVIRANEKKLNANSDITAYEKIYVGGKKLPLVLSDINSITSEAVYIKELKSIKPLFIDSFSESFFDYAKDLAGRYGFHIESFKVKAYKSRWGCCDRKRNISFNYFLFMLPQSLQRYVIIHELCHTVYFNHSTEFWKLVSRFVPDYKELRKQLKSFDFIIKLY